jgi:hypothetical protein
MWDRIVGIRKASLSPVRVTLEVSDWHDNRSCRLLRPCTAYLRVPPETEGKADASVVIACSKR